jgi:D-sedoheptulose 7-phosphate isomerase
MDPAAVARVVAESVALKQRFFEANTALLLQVGDVLAETLRRGGRVLTFGNGGSAADAQHLAGELVVRFRHERRALSALALTTDPSVITAIGNDLGYDAVFARQVEAHGRPGDVAFAISTSGLSPNVVAGLEAARAGGLVTVALTGRGGGRLVGLADHLIDVSCDDTARIQEVHGMAVHLLCQIVEEAFV